MRLLMRGSRGLDVSGLQGDLNRIGGSRHARLAEDGIFGPLTEQRVRELQTARKIQVDGKVGPQTRGEIAKALKASPSGGLDEANEPKSVPVKSTPAPKAPESPLEPSSPHVARRVDPGMLADVRYQAHDSWDASLIGRVEPKAIFRGPDGRRMVVEVFQGAVVYVLVEAKSGARPGLYAQTKFGFITDVKSQPYSDAAKGAEGMVKLAHFEGGLMLGIASAAHWTGFVLVSSLQLLRFVAENQHQFQRWREITEASLEAREVLERDTPTFYRIVMDELLYQHIPNVLLALPRAVYSKPESMGKIIGSFFSKAGNVKLARSKLGVIWHISTYIGGLAAEGFFAIPKAVDDSIPETPNNEAEVEEAVAVIYDYLRSVEARAGQEKVHQALREIRDNHRTVLPAIQNIARAAQP